MLVLYQVFKSKTAERFLFVRPGTISWSICPDLKGDTIYMEELWSSESVDGHRCPAIANEKDWGFNTNGDGEGDSIDVGEVVLSCSTHAI